jgi:Fe-S cluster biogenesis protein NfuA
MRNPTAGATPDRIGTLLRAVGAAPTVERAHEKSEELVRALVELYGQGLERVLDIVHEAAGERSETIFAALCNDRCVEDLLALHGLHPLSLDDRVRVALDSIRPYLESHGGNVELVRIEDGVAYVRMGGSCDGCRSSAATLKNAVESAIFERISEISAVRTEAATLKPAAASY